MTPVLDVTDLSQLTLVEAAAAIRHKDVSPVELCEHYLATIEATEPVINAYVTVDADRARADAASAEAAVVRGDALGPLHGVPLGVKDMFDTAGWRTTYGSASMVSHIPVRDASAVRRLRKAGAVILGKHATHEFAWGGRTDSSFYGPTRNPHRSDRIAGGSSGGSAASVAAGSSLGAIGSDTAGSVRIPAALSGCVGFKPTRGRVSRSGLKPLAPSLDHVGTLARTVPDAVAIVDAIAGIEDADPGMYGLGIETGEVVVGDLDIGFLAGWPTELLSSDVAQSLAEVRRRLPGSGLRCHDARVEGEAPTEAILTRILAEAGAYHRPAFLRDPTSFGDDLAQLLALAPPSARVLAQAQGAALRSASELLALLVEYDVIVLPTVAVTAPRIGESLIVLASHGPMPVELVLTRLTSVFNVAGLPAISVPGPARDLPVGIQVVGRPGADHVVAAAASAIHQLISERTPL